ncbi:protoporphyrinogen oxidase [Xenopus tropicalis]|nr:protoporphyrinogen oxidase [Xenopus tropicalis]
MLGGAWFESSIGDPDAVSSEKVLELAKTAAAEQLGVRDKPSRSIVNINKDCIPQYTLGHWRRTGNISAYTRQLSLPLSLIGASYHGVSVNDCIYNARQAVHSLLGH